MAAFSKKFIWIPLLLLVTFTGDRLGAWVLGQIVHHSAFRFSRLYRGDAACDVLFIGNSRGLIFYQPYIEEVTGLETCNLSYNAMPMHLAAALVQDHLDLNPIPKLLVIDITLLDARMDEKLSAGFNCYRGHSVRLRNILEHRFPKVWYGGAVSHLYRYNSEVFQRALYYLKKSDEDWLLDRVITPTLQARVQEAEAFRFDYTPEMLSDLAQTVQYARARGVEVRLVVNPYYPPFAKKITNLNTLIADVTSTTGLTVHDYSGSIAGTEGFGDYQHLNKEGSRQYIDLLIKDGILEGAQGLGWREE